MKHMAGQDRFQAITTTLEERISADYPVRGIDAFVEVLPLEKMGFTKDKPPSKGRPSYQPRQRLTATWPTSKTKPMNALHLAWSSWFGIR